MIAPPWYLVGATGFLYGFFELVERTPFEITFLITAAGFVYLSVLRHSRTLLFVATIAILSYTAWFTGEHFADSVGWTATSSGPACRTAAHPGWATPDAIASSGTLR